MEVESKMSMRLFKVTNPDRTSFVSDGPDEFLEDCVADGCTIEPFEVDVWQVHGLLMNALNAIEREYFEARKQERKLSNGSAECKVWTVRADGIRTSLAAIKPMADYLGIGMADEPTFAFTEEKGLVPA